MGRDDWFRNETWSPAIEQAFNEKWARARDKAQPLKIQAVIVGERFPNVALDLIDRYFELEGDGFFDADAYCARAQAYERLGRIDDAIASYVDSLDAEARQPNSHGPSYLYLALLAIRHDRDDAGDRALREFVLREDRGDVRFANEVFVGSALAAMTLKKAGLHTAAREQAERALRMTTVGSLGIRNAPDMGMVRPEHADVVAMMRRIAAGRRPRSRWWSR